MISYHSLRSQCSRLIVCSSIRRAAACTITHSHACLIVHLRNLNYQLGTRKQLIVHQYFVLLYLPCFLTIKENKKFNGTPLNKLQYKTPVIKHITMLFEVIVLFKETTLTQFKNNDLIKTFSKVTRVFEFTCQ